MPQDARAKTQPQSTGRREQQGAAMQLAAPAALALGGVVLLGAAVGALLLARAAIRARRHPGTADDDVPVEELDPQASSPMPAARAMAVLMAFRHVTYWVLTALAVSASWLARIARPPGD